LREALARGDGDARPASAPVPDGPPVLASAVVVHAPPRARELMDLWGPVPSLSLMRAVKDQFDPGHRMAPGRFAGGICWRTGPVQAGAARSVRAKAVRAAIFATFPYPQRLRALSGPLRAAQRAGFDRLAQRGPLARYVPELAGSLRLAPRSPGRQGKLPARIP